MPSTKIVTGDCLHCLSHLTQQIDLTFCDPPFNQGHFYRYFNDKQEEHSYWHWLSEVLSAVRAKTTVGGMIYFMHREKMRNSRCHLCGMLVGLSKISLFGKK